MVSGATKSSKQMFLSFVGIIFGAFIAAFSLEVFLLPNRIIDGGVIGIAILISEGLGTDIWLYPMVLLFNIPFLFLAYKYIAKTLLVQMLMATISFVFFGHFITLSSFPIFGHYHGDLLEIVVIGGGLLGFGVGLIIRCGGCLDGTEILGIMLNKKYGLSVGTIVLCFNIVLFLIAGLLFEDIRASIQSLITFLIVIKIMDMVIVGLDEMKSIMIFSDKTNEIAEDLVHKLGLGLTFIRGRGGFKGDDKEIIYLIAERLQLSEIKTLVQQKDPSAFMAIDNLHEVATQRTKSISKKPSLKMSEEFSNAHSKNLVFQEPN